MAFSIPEHIQRLIQVELKSWLDEKSIKISDKSQTRIENQILKQALRILDTQLPSSFLQVPKKIHMKKNEYENVDIYPISPLTIQRLLRIVEQNRFQENTIVHLKDLCMWLTKSCTALFPEAIINLMIRLINSKNIYVNINNIFEKSNTGIFLNYQNHDKHSVELLESIIQPSTTIEPIEKSSNYRKLSKNQRHNYNIELALVQQLLYTFQGIDSHLIKYDSIKDRFIISENTDIPTVMQKLTHKLSETGWLYKKVSSFVTRINSDESNGLVMQNFASAVHNNLIEYFRMIAILQTYLGAHINTNISDIDSESNEGSIGELPLTLRQLNVWVDEPSRKLQLLAELIDSIHMLQGGAALSVIHIYSWHGDKFVQSFLESILLSASALLFESIKLWVTQGELNDPYGEFFVAEKPIIGSSIDPEHLWFEQYTLRNSMIPIFINKNLARKILLVGKSINFIRDCCQKEKKTNTNDNIPSKYRVIFTHSTFSFSSQLLNIASFEDENQTYEHKSNDEKFQDSLVSTINLAARKTNKYLLSIIFDEFHLIYHLKNIKQYLLLGKGDTVEYLMDIVSPILDMPAEKIQRHHLAAALESALRLPCTVSSYDKSTDCLMVNMLNPSTGECGWDIFQLDYALDLPLKAIITKSAMSRYRQIFQFLWKIKRAEHSLAAAWKIEIRSAFEIRKMKLLLPILHKFHLLRNEMMYFIKNLHSYIMFEVLETSWKCLEKDLGMATDLDQLVAAHDKFIFQIIRKSLILSDTEIDHSVDKLLPLNLSVESVDTFHSGILPKSSSISNSLLEYIQSLFAVILRFCGVQKRLYKDIRLLLFKLNSQQENIVLRTSRNQWGIDETDENYINPDQFALESQKEICDKFMVTVINISDEYRHELCGFLVHLESLSSDSLKFLRFRLNFNSFYVSQS